MKQHRLWWQSSYDRGIQHILKMWPKIREKYPDAELWIAYGWETFDSFFRDNPERMDWKKRIDEQMKQPGITHYGRIGQDKLKELRPQCAIWAYPTHFTEINCMGALESQADGVVPCVIELAALEETVQSGVKVKGDIYEQETYDAYLKELLDLMGDEKRLKEESEKGKEFAKQFTWEKIAKEWTKYL